MGWTTSLSNDGYCGDLEMIPRSNDNRWGGSIFVTDFYIRILPHAQDMKGEHTASSVKQTFTHPFPYSLKTHPSWSSSTSFNAIRLEFFASLSPSLPRTAELTRFRYFTMTGCDNEDGWARGWRDNRLVIDGWERGRGSKMSIIAAEERILMACSAMMSEYS